MPDSLHGMTLAQKILQTDIPILNLKFLNNNNNLSPLSLIDQPKATLIYLRLYLELVPFYFDVWVKLTVLGYALEFEFEVGLALLGGFLAWGLDFLEEGEVEGFQWTVLLH